MNSALASVLSEEIARYRKWSWLLMGGALLFILWKQLIIALLAGLLVHELVFLLEPTVLRLLKVKRAVAQWALVVMIAAVVVTVLILLGVGIFRFFHAGTDNLPALLNKMAEVLESSRNALPANVRDVLPANVADLQVTGSSWLREHAAEVTGISKGAGRAVALALIGMIIGALVALRNTKQHTDLLPFPAELSERVNNLAMSFRRVVFAQMWIASINATVTGIYLAVVLPLLGIHLPFTKTMIALTFIFGLVPVVGNLASNTVIVVVSLANSVTMAMASLAFLVVIHKTEYFLNARIVGSMIRSQAWELLIAMVLFESLFGIAGVVAAPIYYAYIKAELRKSKLL